MPDQMPAVMSIAITEARQQIKNIQGFIPKIEKAMLLCVDHWICTDEQQRFRSAVGAVMAEYGPDSDEFKRLVKELKILEILANGLEKGIDKDSPEFLSETEGHNFIGLVGMWYKIQQLIVKKG